MSKQTTQSSKCCKKNSLSQYPKYKDSDYKTVWRYKDGMEKWMEQSLKSPSAKEIIKSS